MATKLMCWTSVSIKSGQQDGNVHGAYLSRSVRKGEAADRVGDKDRVVSVGDAVVLDGVHETRVGGKARVVNKLEPEDLAEPGSSSLRQLCDMRDIEAAGIVVLLESHIQGHLRGEALDVIANDDVSAPELLARDEGDSMRRLDLVVENFSARLTVDEEKQRLSTITTRLQAKDAKLLGIFLEDVL